MSIPAARVQDACSCALPNGSGGPPGIGQGSSNVHYNSSPAHAVGDKRPCSLGLDTVLLGSPLVTINGKRAARPCVSCMAHGGSPIGGSPNVRIGGPSVAGDVSRWTKACMKARANRSGPHPEQHWHQSYNNCGPEAVRTVVQEITGKEISEREFLEWAIDHNWAAWRDKGDEPAKQKIPDPTWDRVRINEAQPTAGERNAAITEAGDSKNGDWQQMLHAKGVDSQLLDENEPAKNGFGSRAEQAVREGSSVLLPIDSGYNGDSAGGNHVVIVSGIEYAEDGSISALYVNDTSEVGGCGLRVPIAKIAEGVKTLSTHKKKKDGSEREPTFPAVPIRVGGPRW